MRDHTFNDTTMGMLKAHHFLTEQQNRPPKRKFTYEKIGTMVHARRCLKRNEREQLESALKEFRSGDQKDDERVKSLMSKLQSLPVTFVPVKRQTSVDTSRMYPDPVVFA